MPANAGRQHRLPAARPDLSSHALIGLLAGLCLLLVGYLLIRPLLPEAWQRPGSPVLQSAAILGSILLLSPFALWLGKRTGLSAVPNRLYVLHVVASTAGMFLVGMHAAASLRGPPLFMVVCLALLVVTGMVGRVYLSGPMAATFGSKSAPFRPVPPELKNALRQIIREKDALLGKLDPQASEALFSVTLRHWVRAPRLSLAYQRLVWREAALTGQRASVPPLQAYWRPAHIVLAWLFLAALVAHVVLVTFLPGYVAGEGEIYWWHLGGR
ncbi:hypothetical protein [Thioalkalivibrio thiocyanodenitrificans]|uniref:hypothetical protein n=1 Tax=Thioalkalivibrio thiocyanodenitrificans TaxID=243063 RepID=UPI0003735E57|nr:hypothetical protein [Thioalkalivibrio thiocyanodenitrificans]